MTDFEKAQLISLEMDRLRGEISMCARSIHKTVFVFITTFAGIMGVYFGGGEVLKTYKPTLLLVLSQVEVLLCLFYASLFAYSNVRHGYLRALEKKINSLAGDRVVIWSGRIYRRYMQRLPSAFIAASVSQGLGYFVVFGVSVYFTLDVPNQFLWGVLFTLEAVVCLGLIVWARVEVGYVERLAKKK